MNEFFKELKVIELANVLAGPAVGMFFAELGSDVIKIENKLTNGDVTRSWKVSEENPDYKTSAYYASVNWGKKSLFINYNIKEELQQVYDLIKGADIIISNFKYSSTYKFGLDYESIKKINPSIIYGHISAYGEDNPRTAYDLILQAETGYMFINGTPEVSPLKLPIAFIDILAAHQMKEGIMAAIIKKIKSGKGSKVTVSLYDTAIASLSNQASNWLTAKHNPQPIGSLHPNIAPYGEIFKTKDNKQVVLAIGSNKHFELLCKYLKLDNLINDSKFCSNKNRVLHRSILQEFIQEKIEKLNSAEIMLNLLKNEIPAGVIKSIKEIFENENNSNFILENIEENMNLKRVKSTVFQLFD